MTSGDVDLEQVEEVLMAAESQDECRGQNMQSNSPMLSWPPMRPQKQFYKVLRPKHQRGRVKFEARNISGRQEDEEGYQSCNNPILHAREGIGTSLDLTIKFWTLQEGPEGIQNWCNINMNVPSRVRGPRGQEEANKGLGVAEAKWKHQNDAGGVRMDGTMSSMCCDLKRVEMKLLAEDEAGQHQWQLYRPRNIPGPPTRL
ncbi:hypothetical protein PISMIDRAFT_19933 [Pisolithus microcarpus 441]|uniref:Uncharacterized protein n=1 Tax=Pisolithus microcarpus 441 TaxID=765257 RepID=A0A0C9YKV5_9AGAM|nr:hypothetical protein BKA83DRAFT_19933 [Pisolithus microcarpus]KIK10947.1 hypothetical protein PISMIDRAFT_19933 [Pisolithus microcarpus 441]